jgi:hypothetical protein
MVVSAVITSCLVASKAILPAEDTDIFKNNSRNYGTIKMTLVVPL